LQTGVLTLTVWVFTNSEAQSNDGKFRMQGLRQHVYREGGADSATVLTADQMYYYVVGGGAKLLFDCG
jgi:hypothetical protein